MAAVLTPCDPFSPVRVKSREKLLVACTENSLQITAFTQYFKGTVSVACLETTSTRRDAHRQLLRPISTLLSFKRELVFCGLGSFVWRADQCTKQLVSRVNAFCSTLLSSYCKSTFEALKIFWDITPRSPVKVHRRFGQTCRLHFQARTVSRARNKHEASNRCENFKIRLPILWI
jgi:hypothetical protein